MTKILIVITMLFSSTLLAAKYPANYKCVATARDREDIALTIYGSDEYLINGVDTARLDTTYKRGGYWERLEGFLGSIGDGEEGYKVNLLINKYIVRTKKFGYMMYQTLGADGFYSVHYKCTKYKVSE